MNNGIIFVDTGAWFAALAKNDQYHTVAIKYWNKLRKENVSFITSNLVVHETTMLLERKIKRREAIRFLSYILKDTSIQIVHADEDIEQEGLTLYQKFYDHDFSVTDCVSFALMNSLGIHRCLTFDKHFSEMDFTVEPHTY